MPYMIPAAGSNSRPPDVSFPNWMKGQPAGLDVTMTSSIQQLTCRGCYHTRPCPDHWCRGGRCPLMQNLVVL